MLRLHYLYRDFSNYKQYHSLLFSNPQNRSIEEIETLIKPTLLDETWFLHEHWQVPDLHFEKTDWEQDHPYHEYEKLEIADQPNTSPKESIEELLIRITKK